MDSSGRPQGLRLTHETYSSSFSPKSTCQDVVCSDAILTSLPSMPSATMPTLSQPDVDAGTSTFGFSDSSFLNTSFFTSYLASCSSSASGQSRSSSPSTLACDPATCPIIPGCETTIDISKGRTGLGLSIVGGCDTLLVENEKYEYEI